MENLICEKCGKDIRRNEYVEYGKRCENCYIGNEPSGNGSPRFMKAKKTVEKKKIRDH